MKLFYILLVLFILAYITKFRKEKKPVKNILAQKVEINSLSKSCLEDEIHCIINIVPRIVSIQSDHGSGTGFIVEGDRNYLTVITASHVIRNGNGKNSFINKGLFVLNFNDATIPDIVNSASVYLYPLIACAFFKNSYSDIGLIKIPNKTNIIFNKVSVANIAKRGDEVFIIDQKNKEKKRLRTLLIDSFDPSTNEVILSGESEPGTSGSPILTKEGKLLGVLSKSNKFFTYGTYRVGEAIEIGVERLFIKESHLSPYICTLSSQ